MVPIGGRHVPSSIDKLGLEDVEEVQAGQGLLEEFHNAEDIHDAMMHKGGKKGADLPA